MSGRSQNSFREIESSQMISPIKKLSHFHNIFICKKKVFVYEKFHVFLWFNFPRCPSLFQWKQKIREWNFRSTNKMKFSRKTIHIPNENRVSAWIGRFASEHPIRYCFFFFLFHQFVTIQSSIECFCDQFRRSDDICLTKMRRAGTAGLAHSRN